MPQLEISAMSTVSGSKENSSPGSESTTPVLSPDLPLANPNPVSFPPHKPATKLEDDDGKVIGRSVYQG